MSLLYPYILSSADGQSYILKWSRCLAFLRMKQKSDHILLIQTTPLCIWWGVLHHISPGREKNAMFTTCYVYIRYQAKVTPNWLLIISYYLESHVQTSVVFQCNICYTILAHLGDASDWQRIHMEVSSRRHLLILWWYDHVIRLWIYLQSWLSLDIQYILI